MPQLIPFEGPAPRELVGTPINPDRFDSSESAFFSRELQAILPEVINVEPSRLNFLDLIPTRAFHLGVSSIAYRSTASIGKAAFIGPKGNDLPTINEISQEDTAKYKMFGCAVVYSLEEIKAAEYAALRGSVIGQNLERDLLRSGRRAMEELTNRCAWYGDANAGLFGLLQNVNILAGDAANALGGSSTAAQCLAVMNAGANAIPNNTEQVEEADTILLPPDSHQYVGQLQNSTASDRSVLEYWLATNGYVSSAAKVRELSNATIMTAGVEATTDCAVYYRNDPSILELPYSGITVEPPQRQGMNFIVLMYAKVGSLLVKRPKAIYVQRGV